MACEYKYKGKTYTNEEFTQYIKDNPAEFSQGVENSPTFLQTSDSPTPSRATPKVLKLVNEFFNKAGFDVRKVNQVVVNGQKVDANGVADVLNRIVQVVDGKEDTVLPEEAMHIAVEMIEQQNPDLFNQMLNKIGSYNIYPQILSTYRNNPFYMTDGKPNIRKIKKEAMARILVETVIDQTEGSNEKPENLARTSRWWQSIIEWFKSLFTKYGNPFEEAGSIIVESTAPNSPYSGDEIFLSRNPDAVNASLKVVQALRSPRIDQIYKRFYATNKEKFYQELGTVAPKEQVAMLRTWNETNSPVSLDEMITGVLSELSYTVEIVQPIDEDGDGQSAAHYSSLTVPGGTNYKENEIRTPNITPSIKGHAAFASPQGIGWFRSDEVGTSTPTGERVYDGAGGFVQASVNTGSKTRRILELQSDIFQKGRDYEALTATESRTEMARGKEELDKMVTDLPDENNFLQVLNKDANWVRFFVQSIVQDSVKKGYEKVRFPLAETVAKIEKYGELFNALNEAERDLAKYTERIISEHLERPGEFVQHKPGEEAIGFGFETREKAQASLDRSIAEATRIRDEAAVEIRKNATPVMDFYSKRVRSVLEKLYKGRVEEITDENGNAWIEVSLDNNKDLGEFYFQLNANSQQDTYNKLKDQHDRLSLQENPDKPGESNYYLDGKKISLRVSSKSNKYYADKFRGKQLNEDAYQRSLNEQKAEKGTMGHKDLENMFHRLIDDNGFVRDEALPQASPSNLNPTDNTFYNTLWENMRERIASYPAGTRFMAEVQIVDERNDIAGTMDFVAIEPSGRVNILDWKFINLREGETDIPWYKVGGWNVQMGEYKRILRDAYGIKKEDFRQTRMIPIRAKYRFKSGTEDTLELSSVQIGPVNVTAITDNTVLPVNTRDESTGNKRLDQLIQNLYNLMDKIYETRAKPGEEYKKIERYNELTSAVRQLHVKGATSDFLDFIYEDVKERIYQALNPYFQIADALENSDMTVATQAIEQLNNLPNLNQLSREILDFEDTLELYADVASVLRTVFDPSAEENKAILQKAEQVAANANITRSKIVQLSNAIRENPIARGVNVQDILNPELAVSMYQKWVRSISQGATAAVDMLWHIVNRISNAAEIEFSDEIRALKKLESDLSKYIQTTGKSWTDVKKMFFNLNSKGEWNGKVISRVAQVFYTDLEKAKQNKDIDKVLDMIDEPAYQAWYEKELQNRIDSFANRRLFADPERDREEKEKRINDFKRQFDIVGEVSTSIAPGNKMLNAFPDLTKYSSDQYKELQKQGNEPVLALYDYWAKKLDDSYELGMIKAWEKKTFFPNVRKDLLDKYVFGSKDKKMRRTTLSFLNSMTIKVDDEVFGYTDVNGNPQDKMGAMYTYDLGEKIINEDGTEFTDYSNKSTDIFKVMALWSKEMAKFKHKSEVVDTVRLLYFTEKNRQIQLRSKITGRPAVKENGDPVLVDNIVNSDYYKNYMDYYFYGKKLSEGQDVRFSLPVNKVAKAINKFVGSDIIPLNIEDEVTISGRKAVQSANRWFQMKTLGLNLTTAASNFFGGTTNALINAGKFFNKQDFFKGQMIIASGKLWGDNSIYAGLIDYFLPLTDDRTKEEADALSVNKATRILSSDHLFYLMRLSDKMVQYPAFLAFADNTMVENGELVNIREWVKQKHNHDNIYNLPIDQQKELTATIEAEINEMKSTRSLPRVASIANDRLTIPGIERNSQTVYNLRNRVQQFAKDALGNMSQEDISQYRMTILGQSFMMFKNWIPRMIDVRYGEFRYQPGTEAYEWGRMRMLFSSLKFGVISSAKAVIGSLGGKNEGVIEIAKKLYEEKKAEQEKKGRTFDMSEAEFIDNYVKGVRAQTKELVLMLNMFALLFFIKSNAPDPDEDVRARGAFKWAARLFDKMTDEVSFFYNPLSFTAIANGSIFPSIQILNDLVRLTVNTAFEGIYFATGDEEALEKNKVAKYLFRTFPITKELTLYMGMFNEELAKEYGIRTSTESRRVY